MNPTVYVETTIPSYYHDARIESARDIERTRQRWDHERSRYECFISGVVLDELSSGAYPTQRAYLELVEALPLLDVIPEVLEIAKAYQAEGLMPRRPAADSVHLALASWYRMDFLLTWNCTRIANASKARRLEAINIRMHLGVPILVTPHQLQPREA